MKPEEFIKSNNKKAQDVYFTTPVVSVAYALTALEMKDSEHLERLKEIRKEIEFTRDAEMSHDIKWAQGLGYAIHILEKHIKKNG